MALPASGPISLSNVNVELGFSASALISLNDAAVRALLQVPSGAISLSNAYGKSGSVDVTVTISATRTAYTLNPAAVPGYQAGATNVTLVINSGVYVYSTAIGTPGLTVTGFAAGDTVHIINNGFILGQGGKGASRNSANTVTAAGEAGGTAIELGFPVSITNNSYIAGGGGGGGGTRGGAGGGAGGGQGGDIFNGAFYVGAVGGAPGAAGVGGTYRSFGNPSQVAQGQCNGAGGGRILPGVGGIGSTSNTTINQGGGSGGGGSGVLVIQFNSPIENSTGGAGGSAGAVGGNSSGGTSAAGGGGGWGASGGSGGSTPGPGSGGKAVNLNGRSVTWLATGTRYGAIS